MPQDAPTPLHQVPRAPYYAVLFTSELRPGSEGYAEAAARMVELASSQPGFLGLHTARDARLGITLSYWESLEAIEAWKKHAQHLAAQAAGRSRWYKGFTLQVARVERNATFEAPDAPA